MDLHLSISDGFVKTKIFDKQDDFDFDIVVDWLIGFFWFKALTDSISVYIGPAPKEREKEKRKDRGE